MDTMTAINSLSDLDKATQWATYTAARLATVPAGVELTPILKAYAQLAARTLEYAAWDAIEQAAAEWLTLVTLGGDQAVAELAAARLA